MGIWRTTSSASFEITKELIKMAKMTDDRTTGIVEASKRLRLFGSDAPAHNIGDFLWKKDEFCDVYLERHRISSDQAASRGDFEKLKINQPSSMMRCSVRFRTYRFDLGLKHRRGSYLTRSNLITLRDLPDQHYAPFW